ncbi:MAG TPA: winged helix-turn-helix transcriptional regulator, partial [Thermoprotei archaeon]|nr:winged helix-turn-helix transcriptional regulator [Thermoprotei archaeon]
IVETICAFSNTRGGIVLVGVNDKGEVVGVDVSRSTIENLVSRIARETNPRIYPEVEVVEFNGRKVIVIRVSERTDKPVFAFGVAYKRVGKSNLKMDRDEILRLFRESRRISFEDEKICTISELDYGKIKSFIERASAYRRAVLPSDPKSVLDNLGMLLNDHINIAGLLAFGRNPQKYFPYACIKIGKFVSGSIIFEKEIKGDIIEQIERAYAEVLSLIKREIKVKGLKREEVYEYPPKALREAVVNAVAHRDYSIKSPIYIRIYEDRIEFENPGGLIDLTVEDLKKPHKSILRNPKIAEVLYYLGFIEKWGIGTLMIIKECILNGNGEPVFESNGSFKLTIFSRYFSSLDPVERKIIDYIREKGVVERREIQEHLKLAESTVRKYLIKLRLRGLIVKIGRGKRTVYKLAL